LHLGNAELWPALLILCPDACSGLRIIVKGLAHTFTAEMPISVKADLPCGEILEVGHRTQSPEAP
jgi:hypothetical protein